MELERWLETQVRELVERLQVNEKDSVSADLSREYNPKTGMWTTRVTIVLNQATFDYAPAFSDKGDR